MGDVVAKLFHRIRFYEGRWSSFDSIEECKKPGQCIGCMFKHPLCDENGRIPAQPAKEE